MESFESRVTCSFVMRGVSSKGASSNKRCVRPKSKACMSRLLADGSDGRGDAAASGRRGGSLVAVAVKPGFSRADFAIRARHAAEASVIAAGGPGGCSSAAREPPPRVVAAGMGGQSIQQGTQAGGVQSRMEGTPVQSQMEALLSPVAGELRSPIRRQGGRGCEAPPRWAPVGC